MIQLTHKIYRFIRDINSKWNDEIQYFSDQEIYGLIDKWAIPEDGCGDCEDIALAKQASLSEMDIPSFIATCWTETGIYHAVLIVPTDRGDFVLDNRYPYVMKPSELEYKWDKREGTDGKWYGISYSQSLCQI